VYDYDMMRDSIADLEHFVEYRMQRVFLDARFAFAVLRLVRQQIRLHVPAKTTHRVQQPGVDHRQRLTATAATCSKTRT